MTKPDPQPGDTLTAQLLRDIRDWRGQSVRTGYGLAKNGDTIAVNLCPPCRIYKTGGGGITAMSGTTPGSGTCTVYRFNGSTVSSETVTETVFNLSTTAVGATKFILAEMVDGYPFVTVESCS